MDFLIGHLSFEVELVDDYILIDGKEKFGGSSLHLQKVFISTLPGPDQRISILWHELLHAVKDVFDIHEKDDFDIEAACNLGGLLPKVIGIRRLCQLSCYVANGIESENFQFVGDRLIIPVLHAG